MAASSIAFLLSSLASISHTRIHAGVCCSAPAVAAAGESEGNKNLCSGSGGGGRGPASSRVQYIITASFCINYVKVLG